ncbi:MAG: YceI family protein [Bacteroidetes bacterium]|nr:YceI family protein [Bacteroidota bacterium]
MKKIQISAIAVLMILTSAFTVSMMWNVANEGVIVSFELPDEGTKGTLSGLRGSIDFNVSDPSTSKITASVNMGTLNTGNAQKDKHLLSSDFFNVEKYPTAYFTSTSIKATNEGFVAIGNLTMKDSTKAVEIPFTFMEDANGGGTFKGTVAIMSSDFGIMKKSQSGKDKVVVTLTVPVKK